MFQCDNCKREYGGIRGLTQRTCPRCLGNGHGHGRDGGVERLTGGGYSISVVTGPSAAAGYELVGSHARFFRSG